MVIEKLDAVNLDCVTGKVIFRDISFNHGEDMPLVLNGLDLHIKAGETVAFVGPSGGGKTMLMKLLLRIYDPLCGCILIHNHKIQNIWLESLRSHVGLVSQDTGFEACSCCLWGPIFMYFRRGNLSKSSLHNNAKKFEFQAKVSRLIDIIINSLYNNKDIFFRKYIWHRSDYIFVWKTCFGMILCFVWNNIIILGWSILNLYEI
ncbi:uncharacterized protein LOC114302102 isoform X1 [Camellia sinensis]|uniref:uncharacterized protein LOC114302102 isoform X1 n=1 Tax=Camellia sinensis TaxID=4442 RepID=UPI0010362144|nr:uncharacterized protein LOC114302102 isoform X1 [Camellia sinensis]